MWCSLKIVNLGWNLQDSSPVRIFWQAMGLESSIHVFISKDEYRTYVRHFQHFNVVQTNSTYVGHVEVLQFTFGDSAKKWKLTREIHGNSRIPTCRKLLKSQPHFCCSSGTSQRIKWIFGTSNALNFDLFSRNNSGEGIQSHFQLRIELIVQVNTIWTGDVFYI